MTDKPRAPRTGMPLKFKSVEVKEAVDLIAKMRGKTREEAVLEGLAYLATKHGLESVPGLAPLFPSPTIPAARA